jgi:hypothetical protein
MLRRLRGLSRRLCRMLRLSRLRCQDTVHAVLEELAQTPFALLVNSSCRQVAERGARPCCLVSGHRAHELGHVYHGLWRIRMVDDGRQGAATRRARERRERRARRRDARKAPRRNQREAGGGATHNAAVVVHGEVAELSVMSNVAARAPASGWKSWYQICACRRACRPQRCGHLDVVEQPAQGAEGTRQSWRQCVRRASAAAW